ncbi:MAPK-activated protein kinase [Halobacterium salinarum NRC-1]|uniref:MAPK-activated protein kinase n=4 Tax=Halobacterium salinarum TaxID=2242 RepID=Q9HR00_HALSA|nr:MAPK-activated protein kinase [Halobacterium salinarum NRC-1]CAP13629.1 ARM/HEAT repeat protein / protein kinase domain protein [Halobacterium salinarum R1]
MHTRVRSTEPMSPQRHDVDPGAVAHHRGAVDTDDVAELAERLHSADADERSGAAWRLVEAAGTEPTAVRAHLEAIVARADDEDVWVRRGVTWVIAELAERQPDALSMKFSELVALTDADDELVRQNGAVAVAGVTKRYPERATAGLSTLASLTRDADPLLARYAEDAVAEVAAEIAARAEDAGYPMLVRTTAEYAALLPDDLTVVTTDDSEDGPRDPVSVSFGADAPVAVDAADRGDESAPPGHPPAEVPDAPSVGVSQADLTPGLELRETVLTTDFRATITDDTLEHGLVTLRRLNAATANGTDSRVVEAFQRALKRWAAVDEYPHIERVLGTGDTWVATRYDGAETLARRGPPATLSEAQWVVDRVTRAVSYAHARGVVHGGLHPGAVRFVETSVGAWDAPVVADWGFAHAASGHHSPPIPAGFAAPEHHDPASYGRFDQSTDVFGLGALAYFLVTGVSPRGGDGVVPAAQQNPALPERVDSLFERSLATSKQARFETVLDFQAAFDECVADLPGAWPA